MNLSLKKPINQQQKEPEAKKTRPNFKPVPVTPKGQRCIGIAQSEFEAFWKKISHIECTFTEKKIVLDKLKEACNWMCRGIAYYNEDKSLENDDKT